MEQTVTATEARIHFGQVMRRVVEKGQRIVVERDGQPQVVILSTADYERLKAAQTEGWQEALERVVDAGNRARAERGDRPLTPPEKMIRSIREERDEQLLGLR